MTRRALAALCISFLSLLRLDGQVNATGTFSGEVTDSTGAAIANAQVEAVAQNTNLVTTTPTGQSGIYTIPLLKPGQYSIRVSAPGFKTEIRKDLPLQIQQVSEQDFRLEVGQIQQEISVSAAAPQLSTESTELGNVISENSTQQLPLNGRNFSQLGLLVPGTNSGPVGGIRQTGQGNETQRAGAEIVADGARGSFNDFMIDGIDDRDQSVATVKVFPNLESIQEFKVQIGNYDAQFASGGAVVNVITRSGSNELHGSAFEFLRNSDLDARQFFDSTIPPYQQNQFGAALGGPIRKNKTFFFVDYQGLRVHEASTAILSEPTAALRSGDFSSYPGTIFDPATYDPVTGTRQPFAGNVIPSNRINPVAQNILAIFPLPNLPGIQNNFRVNNLAIQAQDQFDTRIDHTFSTSDSMFGRFTYGRADITFPKTPVQIDGNWNPLAFAQGNAIAGSLRPNHAPSMQATVQEIHAFGPTLVNQLALGYTRFNLSVSTLDQGYNTAAKLGIQGADTSSIATGMSTISLSDFQGYDASNMPEDVPQNTYDVHDVISYTRGAHSMQFGFGAIHNGFAFLQLNATTGELDFNGAYTADPLTGNGGSGFADFLLGDMQDTIKSALPDGVPYESYTEYGAFAQDQWRATNRLVVTLGLRYDLFTPPIERYNRQSDFVPGPGTIEIAGQNGVSDAILQTQKHDFSPRLGLAYRIGDNTVVRAAYGLFYFNEQGTGGSARLFISYPFAQQYTVNCSSTIPCLNLSNGIPNVLSANNLPTVVYQPTNNLTPNVQQWNFTIERQLTPSLLVRGSYVGSHGNHLNIALNENVAYPGPGPVPPRQPYPQDGKISAWESRGFSNYDGLQLSAEKRLSHGLSFLGAYTWSKSLDEGAGGNSSDGESRINVQNPRDLAAEYGLSNFDYRQRFTLSTLYELPFGRGRAFLGNTPKIVDLVTGGWQLSTILTLQSGAPFTVNLANGTANTGTFTRPSRICNGNLSGSQQNINEFFDVACFVTPPPYTFGNAGRNILIGPGFETWDVGLDKDFRLTERVGLQFRSEFFNVLNHPNFGIPNNAIGAPGAGTDSYVISNARLIQFALRMHW